MKKYLKKAPILAVVLIIVASLPGCISPQDEEKAETTQTVDIDKSGLPTWDEMNATMGDIARITPVYENKFIQTITSYGVWVEWGNLSEIYPIKTRNELAQLNKTVRASYPDAMKIVTGLETKGCHDVVIAPKSSIVVAHIGRCDLTGNVNRDEFTISSKPFTDNEWGYFMEISRDWHNYSVVSENISIQRSLVWGDYDRVYYRVAHWTNFDGVNIQKIEELNQILESHNATIKF